MILRLTKNYIIKVVFKYFIINLTFLQTFLKSENMTHSPVPCRRFLFNASADDVAMPDVDINDEMVRYNMCIIYCTFKILNVLKLFNIIFVSIGKLTLCRKY